MKRVEYEKDFQKWCVDNKKIRISTYKNNKKRCRSTMLVLSKEFCLYKPLYTLTADYNEEKQRPFEQIIARPDLIFSYKQRLYVAEIKYIPVEIRNFWGGLKCMAYSVYYNWQENKHSRPAMFIPTKSVRLEHQIISNKLGIKLFGISYEKGDWIIIEIDETFKSSLSRS